MSWRESINTQLAKVFGKAESRTLYMDPAEPAHLHARPFFGATAVRDISLDDTPVAFPTVDFGDLADEEVTQVWVRPRPYGPGPKSAPWRHGLPANDFWAGVKRSAALVEGQPKYTQAGLVVSDNFNGALPPVAPELVASLKRGL